MGRIVNHGKQTLHFFLCKKDGETLWGLGIMDIPCDSLSDNFGVEEADGHMVDVQCGSADILFDEYVKECEDILLCYIFGIFFYPAHKLIDTEAIGVNGSWTEMSATTFSDDELFVVHRSIHPCGL